MVKKLFKHELLSYVRLLIPVYLAVFGAAAFGRFVQIFETDNIVYTLGFGSVLILCGLAAIVAGVLTTIFIILRFYRHLFTGEGYLTFTLPATPIQHLWVKLITAFLCQVVTFLVILLSAMLLGAGDVTTEVFKAAGYLLKLAYAEIGGHLVWFILEFFLLVCVAVVSETLVYYTCIAIGQTFKKNRVLAAVGVYFAYTMIVQGISTVISIVMSVASPFLPMDEWMTAIEANPYPFVHSFIAVMLAISVGLSVLFFFITRSILKNKLNLE